MIVHAPPGAEQALSSLHAVAFEARGERGWTVGELAALMATPGTFALVSQSPEGPDGFILLRHATGEAEVLTLAVSPQRRRQGVGAGLLNAGMQALRAVGVARLLLEVAQDNTPAQALYAQAGFTPVGRRRGYYKTGEGAAVDALVMARDL